MNFLLWASLLAHAAISASGIFIPLLAQELGMSYLGLGIASSAFWLGSVASYYLFGRLSDELGEKSKLIKGGLLFASACFFGQLFANDFVSLTALRFLAGFSIGVYAYPLVALVASQEKYKRELGTLSAFGALGWFLGSIAAAFFTEVKVLFALSGGFFLIAFALSLKLPAMRTPGVPVPLLPIGLIRRNFPLYFAYLLRHLGASAVWVIQPLLLQELGADKFWIGVTLALNPFAQFFLMKKVGELTENKVIDDKKLIRIGAIASALVFAAYAIIPNFYFALLVSLLIAISWSFLYVGSMVYLTSRNAEKATATGLLGSFLSLASVLGLFAGGALSEAFGIRSTLAFAFALCVASLFVSREL